MASNRIITREQIIDSHEFLVLLPETDYLYRIAHADTSLHLNDKTLCMLSLCVRLINSIKNRQSTTTDNLYGT